MHVVLTNQIADILHFNGNDWYHSHKSGMRPLGLSFFDTFSQKTKCWQQCHSFNLVMGPKKWHTWLKCDLFEFVRLDVTPENLLCNS